VVRLKKFYVTTPIYYVNASPHIGHAYTTIAADVLARWHRLKKQDVFFLTGTDEHGEKIQTAAEAIGKTPKGLADEVSEKFREAWKRLTISNDDFIRTTDARHTKVVAEFIRRLNDNGDIYKGEYVGWYCIPDETFWTQLQLKNGRCPECGREVELVKEEAYFFRLSKYQERLLRLYEENPSFLSPPSRSPEIITRVQEELKDLCVTRRAVRWAVQFPLDGQHYVYVWLDALINYLSALDWPNGSRFIKYWPPDVQLVGKEINWFHSVIWPALLMSVSVEPPRKVFSHGWWTVGGEKMSKSRGNVVDPVEVCGRYSVDAFRYFVLREMAFGDDGDFSEAALRARVNGELVADLGNLLNRAVTLAEKYEGKVQGKDEVTVNLHMEEIKRCMDLLGFHGALAEIWVFIRSVNSYVNERRPWKLRDEELGNVLYNLLESLRIISILVSAFMPETSAEMNRQLGIQSGFLEDCTFKTWQGNVRKGRLLFEKIRTPLQ